MNRVKKEKLVANYLKMFNGYRAIFLVRNLGLSVLDFKNVRLQFKKIGSKLLVGKNSLLKIALSQTKFFNAHKLLSGPNIVVYSDDPISASKLLVKISDSQDKFAFLGGALPDQYLTKNDIISLSQMLTQDEIRSKIIALLNASARGLAVVLNEPKAGIARALKRYTEK